MVWEVAGQEVMVVGRWFWYKACRVWRGPDWLVRGSRHCMIYHAVINYEWKVLQCNCFVGFRGVQARILSRSNLYML